jgi:hypothetical protein
MKTGLRSGSVYFLVLLLALGCLGTGSNVFAQVTVGLIKSVYLIRFGGYAGTCFTLTVDDKEYVITAKHIVEGIRPGDKIGLYNGGGWDDFTITPIAISNHEVDIAILAPQRRVSETGVKIEAGSLANRTMVQEVYFLGFPYGGRLLVGTREYRLYSKSSLNHYPVALVKRGIVAGVDSSTPGDSIIFIDAMNNPGFSGAPVVVYDNKSNSPKIIGVVTARIPEELMAPEGTHPPPLGANSGIVIAHDISPAVDAIRDYERAHH